MELLERVLLVELFPPRLLLFLLELQPLELAKLLLELVSVLGVLELLVLREKNLLTGTGT